MKMDNYIKFDLLEIGEREIFDFFFFCIQLFYLLLLKKIENNLTVKLNDSNK